MRLRRLWIGNYKNLRDCEVEFPEPHLLNAIIGNNGSGKSNVIEAIVSILIGFYFKRTPPFDFTFEFEAQKRVVSLAGSGGNLAVSVDGERKPVKFFSDRLRDGSAQTYYPELTLVYYSGECQRVRQMIRRYQRHFERLCRKPETDRLRPLFVHATNAQAQVILLALFAHGHMSLPRRLGLKQVENVTLVLRSPPGFDPERDEPKLWNTVGAVRRVVAAIEETATSQQSRRLELMASLPDEVVGLSVGRRLSRSSSEAKAVAVSHVWDGLSFSGGDDLAYREERIYQFANRAPAGSGLTGLAERLEKSGDNLYLALEHLRARGIFRTVSFQLVGRQEDQGFEFDQLSEGEKQLLAVVGALQLVKTPDNFVLLDEPDTHLNPQWCWDYPSLLEEAFEAEQRKRSTVLIATHTPIMISGMTRDQVHLAHMPSEGSPTFTRPRRHPRGQGIANLLCSSEYFGLPSSLDKETQKLLDERLAISVKEKLTDADKARLRLLNEHLEMLSPGISERDPDYVAFLRERHQGE